MTIDAGRYTEGEIPAPLSYSFLDSTGEPLDLDGYTAIFVWRIDRADPQVRVAALDGHTATHAWTDGDLDTAGFLRAAFWVDNGTNRFASVPIVARVAATTTPHTVA
jgi:hypothetical protein